MNKETYKTIRIKSETYKKIRLLAFEKEIPITRLIDLMLADFESVSK